MKTFDVGYLLFGYYKKKLCLRCLQLNYGRSFHSANKSVSRFPLSSNIKLLCIFHTVNISINGTGSIMRNWVVIGVIIIIDIIFLFQMRLCAMLGLSLAPKRASNPRMSQRLHTAAGSGRWDAAVRQRTRLSRPRHTERILDELSWTPLNPAFGPPLERRTRPNHRSPPSLPSSTVAPTTSMAEETHRQTGRDKSTHARGVHFAAGRRCRLSGIVHLLSTSFANPCTNPWGHAMIRRTVD